MKVALNVMLGIIIIIVAIVALELLDIGIIKYFGTQRVAAKREVYEESKPYVHGKIQDLAKYYKEWNESSDQDKKAIETVIRSQFANFKSKNIDVPELKRFLTKVRGY